MSNLVQTTIPGVKGWDAERSFCKAVSIENGQVILGEEFTRGETYSLEAGTLILLYDRFHDGDSAANVAALNEDGKFTCFVEEALGDGCLDEIKDLLLETSSHNLH